MFIKIHLGAGRGDGEGACPWADGVRGGIGCKSSVFSLFQHRQQRPQQESTILISVHLEFSLLPFNTSLVSLHHISFVFSNITTIHNPQTNPVSLQLVCYHHHHYYHHHYNHHHHHLTCLLAGLLLAAGGLLPDPTSCCLATISFSRRPVLLASSSRIRCKLRKIV